MCGVLVEEREGFEPSEREFSRFQDERDRPLRHLSDDVVNVVGLHQPRLFGRRDRNRTCNLQIWRLLLCLIELPAFTPLSVYRKKIAIANRL